MFHTRRNLIILVKKMEFIPHEEFARMSLNERLAYVFGTIIIYRRMIIGVLNDPEASDTKKFFVRC